MPGREGEQRVLTNNERQRPVRPLFLSPLFERLCRPGRRLTPKLAFIEHEQRFIGNGQRQHLFTLGAGGFRLRAVWRNIVWDDNDFAKTDLIRQNLDRFEVTIVHRIEGAAVHCLQLSHINHQ
ncbi:Uncharacterised protein [Raoultella ornithinolytica]|nr:Uncharacterised protein [Raoultella ornithinolytica]